VGRRGHARKAQSSLNGRNSQRRRVICYRTMKPRPACRNDYVSLHRYCVQQARSCSKSFSKQLILLSSGAAGRGRSKRVRVTVAVQDGYGSYPSQKARRTPDFLLRGPSHGRVFGPASRDRMKFVSPTKPHRGMGHPKFGCREEGGLPRRCRLFLSGEKKNSTTDDRDYAKNGR
jgi:hypothetical protein